MDSAPGIGRAPQASNLHDMVCGPTPGGDMIRIPHIDPSALRAPFPPLARPDLAAELHFDHRDKVRSAERAPVRAQGLESVERRRLTSKARAVKQGMLQVQLTGEVRLV